MEFDQAEDYVPPRQQQLQLLEPADWTVQLYGWIEAVFKEDCCAVHLHLRDIARLGNSARHVTRFGRDIR